MEVTLHIVGGFILLLLGAEILIRGSAALALRAGVSALAVGLTVVAIGTSSPEIVVSIRAALEGNPGIAVGNVVGSNICNIGLILGLSALLKPLPVPIALVRRDIVVMIIATIVLIGVLVDGRATRIEGALLVSGMLGYVFWVVRSAKHSPAADDTSLVEAAPAVTGPERVVMWYVGMVVAGIGLLGIGASTFVDGATELAETLGVSEGIIGLTLVAVGTSLPEVVTSLVATIRGETNLAVGNVVGSNTFNALGVMGLTTLTRPIEGTTIGTFDLGAALFLAVLLAPLALTGRRLSRGEGAFLLGSYAVFLIVRVNL